MKVWQVDFYYLPLSSTATIREWELTIYRECGSIFTAKCFTAEANAQWLTKKLIAAAIHGLPDRIRVFRPQTLNLISLAAAELGITLEATRNTPELKQVLQQQGKERLTLEKPVPQPLPENLWGEGWNCVNIAAKDLLELFGDRPIPIREIPEAWLPINLKLASTIEIPGIVVYGGKKSLILARWLEQEKPASLTYIPTEIGKSGGLVLETGLVDRWIFNTFENEAVATVARSYESKKQASQGLHFLLVQPDDSGMTYTGFWLLKAE